MGGYQPPPPQQSAMAAQLAAAQRAAAQAAADAARYQQQAAAAAQRVRTKGSALMYYPAMSHQTAACSAHQNPLPDLSCGCCVPQVLP